VLGEAELADLGERPDLTAIRADEQRHRERRDELRSRHERSQAALQVVAALGDRRRRLVDDLRPRRRQAERVRRLADLCRGNGPTRTSLERWVLAAFLEEICQQANVRLAAMTDDRFRLRCDSSRRRGNAPSGLSLTISDAHTGDERDVLSLSGGETFLASLALALALAEMVARGGGRLDSFLLDEGFGSLDAEHIDRAMDGIGRLVAGDAGRLVVVVSHVEQMRQMLEDLIVLDKDDRTGVTRVVSGAGPA